MKKLLLPAIVLFTLLSSCEKEEIVTNQQQMSTQDSLLLDYESKSGIIQSKQAISNNAPMPMDDYYIYYRNCVSGNVKRVWVSGIITSDWYKPIGTKCYLGYTW